MEAETLRTDTVICTGPPDPSYESFLDACLPDLNDFPDAVFAHVWLGRQRDLEIKLGDQDGKLFLVIKSTPGDEYWEKETTTAKEAAKDNALFSGMFDEYPSHYVAWRGKPEGDAWISTHCVEGLECMVGTGSDGVSGRFEMELFLGPASDADPVFADAETAIVSSLAEAGMTDSVERDATSTRHQWTVPAEHDPKWDGFTMTLTKYQLEDTFTDAAGATQHYWAVELWSGHE